MKKAVSVFSKIFFVILAVVILLLIKMQIESGYASLGDGPKYYKTIDPFEYWGSLAVQFFIFLFTIFYVLKSQKNSGEFDILWVTSFDHLNKFEEITKKATFWQKMFGKFEMPYNYPCIKMSPSGNMGRFWWIGIFLKFLVVRIPVVFSGVTEIKIENDEIIFTKTVYYPHTGEVENVSPIEGVINKENIDYVGRYNPQIGLNRIYDINWILIKTKDKSIMNGDILLSVSEGVLSKKQTDKLYERLLEFKNSPQIRKI